MTGRPFALAAVLSVTIAASLCRAQTVQIVNMVPVSNSSEINQDSETTIAVNPLNPLQIAGSAFTPDPARIGDAPNYISLDGGQTWTLVSQMAEGNTTADTSLAFGPLSGLLYASALSLTDCQAKLCHLDVLVSGAPVLPLSPPGFATATLMTKLLDRPFDDQPWVQTALRRTCSPLSDGVCSAGNLIDSEALYVGSNANGDAPPTAELDIWGSVESEKETSVIPPVAPPALGSAPTFLDPRSGVNDQPSIRTAVSSRTGVAYVAFISGASTQSIVVERDDNFGVGRSPFSSLKDSTDHLNGQRVATGLSMAPAGATDCPNSNDPGCMGSQRVGSNLSIAVSPADSAVVYVAWGDGSAGSAQKLHLRKSTDSGQTWSADLQTIATATNPALAVNSFGTVGFLYQQFTPGGDCFFGLNDNVSGCWITHLKTSTDAFKSQVSDAVLANTPNPPALFVQFYPTLGDYVDLLALGTDFYGIFTAWNVPIKSNFPSGVTYQRHADFNSHTLFADAEHTSIVFASVDPFFFHVSPAICDQDCQVAAAQAQSCANTCSNPQVVAAKYGVCPQNAAEKEPQCYADCIAHKPVFGGLLDCSQQQATALSQCRSTCGSSLNSVSAACTKCLDGAAAIFSTPACKQPTSSFCGTSGQADPSRQTFSQALVWR